MQITDRFHGTLGSGRSLTSTLENARGTFEQRPSPLSSDQWRTMARSTDGPSSDGPHKRSPVPTPCARPSAPPTPHAPWIPSHGSCVSTCLISSSWGSADLRS